MVTNSNGSKVTYNKRAPAAPPPPGVTGCGLGSSIGGSPPSITAGLMTFAGAGPASSTVASNSTTGTRSASTGFSSMKARKLGTSNPKVPPKPRARPRCKRQTASVPHPVRATTARRHSGHHLHPHRQRPDPRATYPGRLTGCWRGAIVAWRGAGGPSRCLNVLCSADSRGFATTPPPHAVTSVAVNASDPLTRASSMQTNRFEHWAQGRIYQKSYFTLVIINFRLEQRHS